MVTKLLVTALIGLLLWSTLVAAYETDQFSHRLEVIDDSTTVLDDIVNQTLADLCSRWKGPEDEWQMVNKVYHALGGRHWVDKIERMAMKSPDVDRLQSDRRDSIYQGQPLWAIRVAALFGVGPTIKLNNQLIGTDKLGHFFSQGRKFYRRYLHYHDEAKAAEHSAYTERALFGQMTTGVYSNADLVANYEGYLFYRGLFEDDVVAGKPAILAWKNGGWIIQRKFTFADHVNAYWDEALNINHYDNLLYPHMRETLQTFCTDYERAPQQYIVNNEAELQSRYSQLQLRNTEELRLDHLCEQTAD